MARRFIYLYFPEIPVDHLQLLVEWCDQYSPLVSQDGNDGIVLDIAGCAHLFGGEGKMLLHAKSRFTRMGHRVRGAIADTQGAAWALARFGKRFIVAGEQTASVLDPLPLQALRLDEEAILGLHHLGIYTIAALRKLPKQSLATRFGPLVVRRLDQAFGKAEEPLNPYRSPAPYRAGRILAEPIVTTNAVQYVLHDLLKEICARLDKEHLGSRRMQLDCYRVDGKIAKCEVQTSKPVRSVSHLMRLFSEKLDALNAGFGFETIFISVDDLEAAAPVQLDFSQISKPSDEKSIDALVDRLGTRLGFNEVCRICVCENYLPEYAVKFTPVTEPIAPSAEWPSYRIRPIRLIDPPMRISVSTIHPGGSPVYFQARGQGRRIVRSEGPERLTSEWWREQTLSLTTRDYYRIEDDRGLRFWIFRADNGSWYLHGRLP